MSAITLERIKALCEKLGITVSKLESDLKLGANTIYKWKVSDPSSGKLMASSWAPLSTMPQPTQPSSHSWTGCSTAPGSRSA